MAENTSDLFSVESVLAGLKRFQRSTVEYVFKRLYLDSDPALRFLIADEVGLGKTLVAKGVIAKAIKHLRETLGEKHRIDIVYICSNGSIARQNIRKLNVAGGDGFQLNSRITLLPIQLSSLNNATNKINFVSFTPGTSFDQKSNIGMMDERVLLYKMLQKPWDLKGVSALNLLQGNVRNAEYFREKAWQDLKINADISKRFSQMICSKENAKLRDDFEILCSQFQRSRKTVRPYDQRAVRNRIVGNLRAILAEACIESLEPDIIILDEFQRFKNLLREDDECSELARRLFNYVDTKSNTCARVMLLSATPYKMYTLSDESNAEDHYADFMQTYRFLERDKNRQKEFEELLIEFRNILFSPKQAVSAQAKEVKNRIETLLRKVMVRTERLAATNDRNGMLKEVSSSSQIINTHQIRSYVALDKIAAELKMPNIVEYWKSSPYLLNFMDDYKFKQSFNEAVKEQKFCKKAINEINDCLSSVLLSENDLHSYNVIDPCNARLSGILKDVLDTGAWKTLWIPPSLPYYQPEEPFLSVWNSNFTKRLVFSTWKVVPKVIAIMLSYEVERRMNAKDARNTADARKKRRPLLRFAISEGRETGMPILSIIYPCSTFAYCCDPLQYYSGLNTVDEKLPSVSDVIKNTKTQIEKLCSELNIPETPGVVDESWYWAVPILLDEINGKKDSQLFDPRISDKWSCRDEIDEDTTQDEEDKDTSFEQHIKRVRDLINRYRDGNLKLGKKPDDLIDVLSLLAIAGPATCALRALSRCYSRDPELMNNQIIWLNAAQVGYAFIGMFNSPDITAMLRGLDGTEPYWLRVIEYCTKGCLQSMLDEYLHILRESLGLIDKLDEESIKTITTAMRESMSLRTASLSVDSIDNTTLQKKGRFESFGRVHFAVRFGDEKGDDGNIVTRSDQVRNSFNSPFWPFVLATTSIGQEGLDFHQYCHAVVHWNLPSNPVDLEQREGRIHRYKNHAVRKNVAKKYAPLIRNEFKGDLWEEMFLCAEKEYGEKFDDIVPYWVLQGDSYIERHIPALPLSREIDKSILLKRSLVAYRMVFGQTRQQDIVEYLMSNFKEEDIEAISEQLKIDLTPTK
ncbi:MAG: helicase-related protein [Bacteroidota bacterium]|jgi:hypothetical protein|nr:helicase-related protein [Bacteroidota bacterium]